MADFWAVVGDVSLSFQAVPCFARWFHDSPNLEHSANIREYCGRILKKAGTVRKLFAMSLSRFRWFHVSHSLEYSANIREYYGRILKKAGTVRKLFAMSLFRFRWFHDSPSLEHSRIFAEYSRLGETWNHLKRERDIANSFRTVPAFFTILPQYSRIFAECSRLGESWNRLKRKRDIADNRPEVCHWLDA